MLRISMCASELVDLDGSPAVEFVAVVLVHGRRGIGSACRAHDLLLVEAVFDVVFRGGRVGWGGFFGTAAAPEEEENAAEEGEDDDGDADSYPCFCAA